MELVFRTILGLSFQASIIILIVCLARMIFPKIPRSFYVFLWTLAAIKLLCPFSIPSSYALLPSTDDLLPAASSSAPVSNTNASVADAEYTDYTIPTDTLGTASQEVSNAYSSSINTQRSHISLFTVAMYIWLAGIVVLAGYLSFQFMMLKHTLTTAVHLETPYIRESDQITTPFVLGIIRPVIYLPPQLTASERSFVLAHEQAHIQRFDHLTKLLFMTALVLHWFNPLVWCAFFLLTKDMELACDERVLRSLDHDTRIAYSQTLLSLSAKQSGLHISLAFGESSIKSRIRHILQFKKPSFWILLAGIFLAVIISLLCFSDKKSPKQSELTMDAVLSMFRENSLKDCDFSSYANRTFQEYDNDAYLSYTINFALDYRGDAYTLSASYDKDAAPPSLTFISLTRSCDNASCILYSDTYTMVEDIDVFLNTKPAVDNWMSLSLPDGYTIGDYNYMYAGVNSGCALIEPKIYETYDEYTFHIADDWAYAGSIGIIPPDAIPCFLFENGQLTEKQIHFWNHTLEEKIETPDGMEIPAILYYTEHDLFTLTAIGELHDAGITLSEEETTSRYWYFYFVKEGSDKGYYLALCADIFTKEDAVAIARSVHFTETAFQ